MVFRANGQKSRRLATSRENPQTDERRAWGIPASQPFCVSSRIVASVRIRSRILASDDATHAWELAQNAFLLAPLGGDALATDSLTEGIRHRCPDPDAFDAFLIHNSDLSNTRESQFAVP